MCRSRLFFVVLFLLFPVIAAAQRSVIGRVTDAAGHPVAHARVVADGASRTTGRDGRFRIAPRRGDSNTITVSAFGYASATRTVSPTMRGTLAVVLRPFDMAVDSPLRWGMIVGRITDSAGQPLQRAVITLLGSGACVRSDSNGTFVLSFLSSGLYTILISAIGYTQAIDVVNLSWPGIAACPIVLYPVQFFRSSRDFGIYAGDH